MTKKKEVKELEKELGIKNNGESQLPVADGYNIEMPNQEELEKEILGSKLPFCEMVKQNFLTALEEKYPEQIKEAKKKILEITSKGGQFVNVGDKIAPYFVVKYGWKQQRHLIIIC